MCHWNHLEEFKRNSERQFLLIQFKLSRLQVTISLAWAKKKWKWKLLSHVRLFEIPFTVQFMEFSRPEYWSELPFPSPGDLPNPGMEPRSLALQADSLPAEPQGKPLDLQTESVYFLHIILFHHFTNTLCKFLIFWFGVLCQCAFPSPVPKESQDSFQYSPRHRR